MAAKTKEFIKIYLPENKGEISVADVLKVPEGLERNLMIKKWCSSVWNAYASQHRQVAEAINKILFKTKQKLNEFRKSTVFPVFFAIVKPFFDNIQEMRHYRLTEVTRRK